MVGNIRKRKKGKKGHRKRRKPSTWLWKSFLNSLKKMPRGTQVKRDGLAVTVERRGTSSGIALRHLSCLRHLSRPRLHVWSTKDHTGRETALRSLGLRGRTLKTIRTEVPGGPHTSSRPNYTWGTPGINNCGGPIRRFPFRYCSNLLCAYWSPWPTFFPICFHNGTVWTSQKVLFQLFFILQLGFYFHTSFWSCQNLSHPFWGGIY